MATVARPVWPYGIAALLAVTVGVGAAWYLTRPAPTPPTPPEIGGYVLPQPRALPDVALVDDAGEPFAPAAFAGRWSLLYFGYTYCPDVCPLSLVELASVKKTLAESHPDVPLAVFLVSVDPARDTPARLREYVRYFDPEFRAVTGEPAEVERLATAVGSVFLIPPGQGADNYLVSHSSNVVVLDPEARLAAVITPPHDPAGIVADLRKILAFRTR
jgi:protein SCO1/2